MTNFDRRASTEIAGKEAQKSAIILFGEMLADVFPERSIPGGAPFNVARHLAAFGQNPLLISRLGNDALGDRMRGDMTAWSMDSSAVQIDDTHPSGRVRVDIEDNGHRFEILPCQAYDFIDQAAAAAAVRKVTPSLVYFGSLGQRHDVSKQTLREVLQVVPVPRFLDINLRKPWYDKATVDFSLQQADVVKLNADELEELADMFEVGGASLRDLAVVLMKMFGIARLIVTCGGEGAWQLVHDNDFFHAVPGNAGLSIKDTVGAGDAFAAICILGMALSWSVTTALDRANHFAAAICQIRGAVPDDLNFYLPYRKEWKL